MFQSIESFNMSVFVINRKSRKDRRQHILQQFCQKREFDVHIVEACEHRNGAIGLWKSISHILQNLVNAESDYIIICEDDHEFTNEYNKDYLLESVAQAKAKDADVLLGGLSWFNTMIEVSEKLFWVEKFTGAQFTILFKKFFKRMLDVDFGNSDAADFKIGSLTENKFFMHPFISIQKDFGYSDVTLKNNGEGLVSELFNNCVERVSIFKKVNAFYQSKKWEISPQTNPRFYNVISIPTYIINLPERKERRSHIEKQFKGRNEFDFTIIEARKHNIGSLGLWLSIRRVINIAVEHDDDVIIIAEDDHEFTEYYSWDFLLQNIVESNAQGADYLSGGSGSFQVAVPLTKNKFWVNPCLSTQFIIIYKRFFNKILAEPFDEHVIVDELLSEMTSNKMVLFPYISTQKDFGYSDVTDLHNNVKGLVTNLFAESSRRLGSIQKAYLKYQLQNDTS